MNILLTLSNNFTNSINCWIIFQKSIVYLSILFIYLSLSCLSIFLSCLSIFLSCLSIFLSCLSIFLSCLSIFLSCLSIFLSYLSIFLSYLSIIPSVYLSLSISSWISDIEKYFFLSLIIMMTHPKQLFVKWEKN